MVYVWFLGQMLVHLVQYTVQYSTVCVCKQKQDTQYSVGSAVALARSVLILRFRLLFLQCTSRCKLQTVDEKMYAAQSQNCLTIYTSTEQKITRLTEAILKKSYKLHLCKKIYHIKIKFDSLLYSFSSFYTRPIKRTRKNTVVKLLHYISPFFVLHNCLILQIYCMFLLSVSKIGERWWSSSLSHIHHLSQQIKIMEKEYFPEKSALLIKYVL